ncbi:guanylate kinase [Candidatus Saccharibacteria bacterium]|nr:guanylate kinase [Candidatus Saccharibacteria bacterium]
MQKGKLLVISGVSAGAGKDTIVRMFIDKHPDWRHPASVTTRQSRPGEVEGVDYYFVDKPTFENKIKQGDFLETDFHADNWYGTLKKPVMDLLSAGHSVILRKDVNGSMAIKGVIPKAILVFLDVESSEVLESRIRARNSETEEQIQSRLALAKKEQELKRHFDYVVVNPENQPEKALADVEKAVEL